MRGKADWLGALYIKLGNLPFNASSAPDFVIQMIPHPGLRDRFLSL